MTVWQFIDYLWGSSVIVSVSIWIWLAIAAIGVVMHDCGENSNIFKKTIICAVFVIFGPFALLTDIGVSKLLVNKNTTA